MQAARPDELKTNAFPVVTARISKAELSKWFPVPFEDIRDPEATPEPSKGALAKLANGLYFILYWGELSKELTLRIPKKTDATDFLAALFREVPLLKSRIVWRRPDANLPETTRTVRSGFTSMKSRARNLMAFVPGVASGAKTAPHGGSGTASGTATRSSRTRSSTTSKAPARKR